MKADRDLQNLPRADRRVQRVATAWRRLADDGAPTLIASSGGADSTALALALHAVRAPIAIAHIVHDMRPREIAIMDRDAAWRLANAIGAPFLEAGIQINRSANAEASARQLRYDELVRLARAEGIAFIATAHHADDQLETMLMAMLRGAGLQGLAGIAPSRPLAPEVTLIRPMLSLLRTEAEELCSLAGASWREDETNRDESKTRAALRHRVLPALRDLFPTGAIRACESASLLREAGTLVERRVDEIFGSGAQWSRHALRDEPALIVGAGLRRTAIELAQGVGADALTKRIVDHAVDLIQSRQAETKQLSWPAGVQVAINRDDVRMTISQQEQ